jgi:hypothetical protein
MSNTHTTQTDTSEATHALQGEMCKQITAVMNLFTVAQHSGVAGGYASMKVERRAASEAPALCHSPSVNVHRAPCMWRFVCAHPLCFFCNFYVSLPHK